MGEEELREALGKARVIRYPQGKMVFKRNEEDPKMYWLLTGAVDLLDEKFEARNRTSEDDVAKFPIDNNNPHRLTAVTTKETRLLQIARGEISAFGPADPKTGVEDTEDEEGVDWMSALLSSPLFEFIPPSNIQTLFSKFEEVDYDAGQAVITQGEPGDYFYVIRSGTAKVERTGGDTASVLAELEAGDNFGQDALVSNVPRNATVTMLSKGTLMRLAGPDFESLLMQPIIETLSAKEVRQMISQGEPKTYIIDVRGADELESGKFEKAINIPLPSLRKNLSELEPEAIYITASDGGRRAELAAYILNENGFTAYVLEDEGK